MVALKCHSGNSKKPQWKQYKAVVVEVKCQTSVANSMIVLMVSGHHFLKIFFVFNFCPYGMTVFVQLG